MIKEFMYKAPALYVEKRDNDGKIVERMTTAPIDWDIDPVMTLHQAEYGMENGVLMVYMRFVMEESLLADYLATKTNWEPIESIPK